MSKKRGMNSATTNALPWVLHAISQRRPTAHFRAGDDTAELRLSYARERRSLSRRRRDYFVRAALFSTGERPRSQHGELLGVRPGTKMRVAGVEWKCRGMRVACGLMVCM